MEAKVKHMLVFFTPNVVVVVDVLVLRACVIHITFI